MGTHDRHRHSATTRQRSRGHRPGASDRPGPGSSRWREPAPSAAAERFVALAHAHRSGDAATVRAAVGLLAEASPGGLAGEVERLLEAEVARAWAVGWQPADLIRAVERELGSAEATLARGAVASESASYAELGARVAPGWMAQLEGAGATRWWDPARPYLLQQPGAWADALLAAVHLMGMLLRLPILPRLVDPPSAWGAGGTVAAGSLPGAVLDKVRALLAKAESTTFDAEAEAFTAKAQELMARHRIDRAVLEAEGREPGEAPVGRRISVDDPYADGRAALLASIAEANGCRAVWSKGMGFSTVFGFTGELDAVEELYTSLLVRADAAIRRSGPKRDGAGRSRTTRFRRSFLLAFAARIGQRLQEAVDATVEAATAETGVALVPVLAARHEATSAAAAQAFPDVRTFAPSASDREGWRAGTVFGDQADLRAGPELRDAAR